MIDLTTLTDGQLLKEFIEKDDQGAFAIVVQRHTTMVLSVCRGILGADAEDAAQATFVVLARKATSIRNKITVGPWLHRVAHRTALAVYRSSKARAERERKVAEMTDTISSDESRREEVLALVNRELDALPEKYRRALILFHLENATLANAARFLACPLKTVSSRLVNGREMLRKRLLRHGVAVSGAAVGILLSTDAGAATIPTGFVSATTQAAVLSAAGKAAALSGGVSAKVLMIAESTLRSMFYAQVKLAAIVMAAVGLLGATGAAAYKTMTAVNVNQPAVRECKMKITFSGYNKTETLKDFPALVIFDTNLANFTYSQFASSNGCDLRFRDATETTELNYEVEQWNTNGKSYVWVQVPQFSNNNYIWAYWGNSSAAQSQSTATNGAAWDSNFRGVWHMNVTNSPDSTTNRNNGTSFNNTDVAGIVAGCQSFASNDDSYLDCLTNNMPANPVSMTEEAWIKTTNAASPGGSSQVIMTRRTTESSGWVTLKIDNDQGCIFMDIAGLRVDCVGGPVVTDGMWHYLAGTRDSSDNYSIFIDGQCASTRTDVDHHVPSSTGSFQIGRHGAWRTYFDGRFDGQIDEVRFSSVVRSSNWIWACYMTMASNSLFNSYETLSAGAPWAGSWNPSLLN